MRPARAPRPLPRRRFRRCLRGRRGDVLAHQRQRCRLEFGRRRQIDDLEADRCGVGLRIDAQVDHHLAGNLAGGRRQAGRRVRRHVARPRDIEPDGEAKRVARYPDGVSVDAGRCDEPVGRREFDERGDPSGHRDAHPSVGFDDQRGGPAVRGNRAERHVGPDVVRDPVDVLAAHRGRRGGEDHPTAGGDGDVSVAAADETACGDVGHERVPFVA